MTLSDDERAVLFKLAHAAEMTVSDYVRSRIIVEASKRKARP
jgi:hypothetical protein